MHDTECNLFPGLLGLACGDGLSRYEANGHPTMENAGSPERTWQSNKFGQLNINNLASSMHVALSGLN